MATIRQIRDGRRIRDSATVTNATIERVNLAAQSGLAAQDRTEPGSHSIAADSGIAAA